MKLKIFCVLLFAVMISIICMISVNADDTLEDLFKANGGLPDFPNVSQKNYIIYCEGYRKNRLEMVVFDVSSNADVNIIWNKSLLLSDNSKYKNDCKFYYDASLNEWVKFETGYNKISDYATSVYQSNLNVLKNDSVYLTRKEYVAGKSNSKAGFDLTKDAWTIMNGNLSFSYPGSYIIPPERYYEVCNDIKAFFLISKSGWFAILGNRWGGNCFGLSATAILNYVNKIDLKPFFSREGANLNSYGYDYQNKGVCNALYFSNEVITLIERFQISQNTIQFDSSEVFKGGNHKKKFEQLIEYLNEDTPTPLVVALYYKGEGHAMVTNTVVKPQKTNVDGNSDFYAISLYDPNKPHDSSNLASPMFGYSGSNNAYLYINPKTGEWHYNMSDGNWSDNKNYLLAGNSTIRFYDVTKYSDDFLYSKLTFKPENGKTYAFLSADEVTLNDNAFYINEDEEIVTNNVEYSIYCSSTDNDKFIGKVVLDDSIVDVKDMKNMDAVFLTNQDIISVSVDDESSYSLNTDNNEIVLRTSESAIFDIVLDNENDDGFSAVRINGTSSKGVVEISVKDDGIISVDGNLSDFNAEITVASTERETKTFKCTDISELSGYSIDNTNENSSFGSVVSNWAKEEVEEAFNENLIPEVLVGKDLTQKVDRAEFAAIAVTLYEKLTNSKVVKGNNPFSDIAGNACEDDILKAYKLDITTGTSATTFNPNTNITREQMATMLTRAYKKSEFGDWTIAKDADYPLNFMGVQKFADDDEISDYAKESVYFMARWDIIKGVGDNMFAPKNTVTFGESYGYATREQAVIIALRSAKHL